MKHVDNDNIIRDIIQQYTVYGREDSSVIERAYEYAKKCHT